MEISATNDTTEKDVLKMVQKLKSTFHRYIARDQQPVIETDYENGEKDKQTGGEIATKPWYGTFEDAAEQAKCNEVARHIEDGLKTARDTVLKCEILVPCGLIKRIARDILIMSESEPCGIRGCSLVIHLKDKFKTSELVKIQCDPNTVSTFEIYLTLHEDTTGWVSVKKVIMNLKGCFKNSIYTQTPRALCLAYKLEKQKLYRSNSYVS